MNQGLAGDVFRLEVNERAMKSVAFAFDTANEPIG
jgi:hypothetical protein